MANYALRVPESLFAYATPSGRGRADLHEPALRDGHCREVSALKTETYFKERGAYGELAAFDARLSASPEEPPQSGDGLP